jgi:hypothetical protein
MEWMITETLCNWSNDTIGDFLFEVYGYPSEVWVAAPPVGSDNNTGTEAQPFATIQKGIDTVAEDGTVNVAAGTYMESIDIHQSMTLEGAGAPGTVIDGGGISENNTVVEFGSDPGEELTISGFTIQNGYQDGVGGIFIQSMHTLNLNDCTVRNNRNGGVGAGGILNNGTLIMNRCTVNGNTTPEGGGGINNRGTLSLTNCTISGNSAGYGGGGIYSSAGHLSLTNCTISNNQLTEFDITAGAGIWNNGTMELLNCTIAYNSTTSSHNAHGGGFANFSGTTAYFKNTIVANNTAGDTASNNGYSYPAEATISQGNNLDSENSCGFNQPTDKINTNPLLGPLQDNGGPTFTHALLHGSPAIDAGTCTGAPATDQRGAPRPQGASCDIGAYELAQASVTTATGTGTASFSTINGYITGLAALAESALDCTPRDDLDFPWGLFSFTVTDITPGSTATIVIILPSNAPTNTQYWKCLNGQWVDCTTLLGSNDGDSVLTLTITDGSLGDRDGIKNGQISDPSGPAVLVVAPTAPTAPTVPTATPPAKPRVSLLKPASMSVQYMSINPQRATANQPVTISTYVVNTGDKAGSLNVALKINGQVEQSRIVSVGPQGTQPVKFTVTKAQSGTYTVDIGGQQGSFTILGAGGSTAGTSSSDRMIGILIIIGALVLATVLVVWLLIRRPA